MPNYKTLTKDALIEVARIRDLRILELESIIKQVNRLTMIHLNTRNSFAMRNVKRKY